MYAMYSYKKGEDKGSKMSEIKFYNLLKQSDLVKEMCITNLPN